MTYKAGLACEATLKDSSLGCHGQGWAGKTPRLHLTDLAHLKGQHITATLSIPLLTQQEEENSKFQFALQVNKEKPAILWSAQLLDGVSSEHKGSPGNSGLL